VESSAQGDPIETRAVVRHQSRSGIGSSREEGGRTHLRRSRVIIHASTIRKTEDLVSAVQGQRVPRGFILVTGQDGIRYALPTESVGPGP
jgi:hypothetical protein